MNEHVAIPCLVLGGVSSGVGKTTITCGILRALVRRGLCAAPFKCGPDYLDPSYLSRAAKRTAHNLDAWMMGKDAMRRTFLRQAKGTDLAIVEGVMGIFDGASPNSEDGSTAQVAKWLGVPALLAVDASGMARTLASIVKGVAGFDPDLHLAGAICNRVGSRRHLDLLSQAMGGEGPVILGGLPKDAACSFTSRHLGLVQARREVVDESVFEELATCVESWIDIDQLLELARDYPSRVAFEDPASQGAGPASPRLRIGIAQDEAFSFYYSENLALLEAHGAELVPFSPMHDVTLPEVDGLYIGGGYPELHAATLSANQSMRHQVSDFVQSNRPVYAECGGLMYLTRGIQDREGQRFAMVGTFSVWCELTEKLAALGYTSVSTTCDSLLGPAGTTFRGHQFRYSKLMADEAFSELAYELTRRRDSAKSTEGYRLKNCLASYVHAHWASNPQIPRAFVESCLRARPASRCRRFGQA